MAVLTKNEIAALSPIERMALIEDIWDSFDCDSLAEQTALSEWQREILEERLEDLEANPADEISLADARSQSLL